VPGGLDLPVAKAPPPISADHKDARQKCPFALCVHGDVQSPAVTLVLTVLTHDFVVQASDQRLTVERAPGVWEAVDDEAVKSVFVPNHMAFAFTGPAMLSPSTAMREHSPELSSAQLPTAIWLAHVLMLVTGGMGEAIERLRVVANGHFRRAGIPFAHRACAFIAGGWWMFDSSLDAVCIGVINYSENGVSDKFEVVRHRLGARPYAYHASITAAVDETFERTLRQIVERDAGPNAIGRLLVATIRAASRRHVKQGDATVGDSVIETCLPRAVVEAGPSYTLKEGTAGSDAPTFRHYASGSDDSKAFSPVLATGALLAGQVKVGPDGLKVEVVNDEDS
jgi:hypothetical protein